jgi:hypothetical protein
MPAHGATKVEWPQGESAPTKYWLSTLPADTDLAPLVAAAKMRWRIERDYQELKQELGLDHYEGRGWRGFHHHMALCVAAYGFLVSERQTIPPLYGTFPVKGWAWMATPCLFQPFDIGYGPTGRRRSTATSQAATAPGPAEAG